MIDLKLIEEVEEAGGIVLSPIDKSRVVKKPDGVETRTLAIISAQTTGLGGLAAIILIMTLDDLFRREFKK